MHGYITKFSNKFYKRVGAITKDACRRFYELTTRMPSNFSRMHSRGHFSYGKKPFDVSTLSEPFKILNCVRACVPKITDEEF